MHKAAAAKRENAETRKSGVVKVKSSKKNRFLTTSKEQYQINAFLTGLEVTAINSKKKRNGVLFWQDMKSVSKHPKKEQVLQMAFYDQQLKKEIKLDLEFFTEVERDQWSLEIQKINIELLKNKVKTDRLKQQAEDRAVSNATAGEIGAPMDGTWQPPSDPNEPFPPNSRVQIHSLVAAASLNGLNGTVQLKNLDGPAAGRYRVALENGQVIDIKPNNMHLISRPAPAQPPPNRNALPGGMKNVVFQPSDELGIKIENDTVSEVDKTSTAAIQGIGVGWTIIGINNQRVQNAGAIWGYIQQLRQQGNPLTLTFQPGVAPPPPNQLGPPQPQFGVPPPQQFGTMMPPPPNPPPPSQGYNNTMPGPPNPNGYGVPPPPSGAPPMAPNSFAPIPPSGAPPPLSQTGGSEVQRTLTDWKLGEYANAFISAGWDDPEDWSSMTPDQLRQMGMKEGHVNRFINRASSMGSGNTASGNYVASGPPQVYNEGDQVMIFSKADKQWYHDGVILEVNRSTDRVKVRYNGGQTKKWKPITENDIRPIGGMSPSSDGGMPGNMGSMPGSSSGWSQPPAQVDNQLLSDLDRIQENYANVSAGVGMSNLNMDDDDDSSDGMPGTVHKKTKAAPPRVPMLSNVLSAPPPNSSYNEVKAAAQTRPSYGGGFGQQNQTSVAAAPEQGQRVDSGMPGARPRVDSGGMPGAYNNPAPAQQPPTFLRQETAPPVISQQYQQPPTTQYAPPSNIPAPVINNANSYMSVPATANANSYAQPAPADLAPMPAPPMMPPPAATEAPMPPGWASAIDPGSGDEYFYNLDTGATVWDRPTAAPANPPPPHIPEPLPPAGFDEPPPPTGFNDPPPPSGFDQQPGAPPGNMFNQPPPTMPPPNQIAAPPSMPPPTNFVPPNFAPPAMAPPPATNYSNPPPSQPPPAATSSGALEWRVGARVRVVESGKTGSIVRFDDDDDPVVALDEGGEAYLCREEVELTTQR